MGGGKILCIDDDELGLQVRKMTLESEDFEVSIAADGKSGLDLLAGAAFDLVLLDHSMPGMSGGEVARQIRFRHPGLPVVFLSAYVTLPEEDLELVDGYMTKGESTESLLALIRSLIGKGSVTK